jgi:hypothetical protein
VPIVRRTPEERIADRAAIVDAVANLRARRADLVNEVKAGSPWLPGGPAITATDHRRFVRLMIRWALAATRVLIVSVGAAGPSDRDGAGE